MSTATAPAKTGFENAKFDLQSVPIAKIRLGKYSLRDVDRESEDFMRLRDSIAKTEGPMQPISVRVLEDDPENPGQSAYGLIDGLQRFSCCVDLGFTVIPARVIESDDADVAFKQIIANKARIETKPVEFTNQLRRILNSQPTLTLGELADQLDVSEKWLTDRLSLSNLHPKIGPLVDEGTIVLSNAFALAKLRPIEEQLAFVSQAQTLGVQEFAGLVTTRQKEIRVASRAGREAGPVEWAPTAKPRPAAEIKSQLETMTVAKSVLTALNATTPEEGFKAGVTWVLQLDPETVAIERQKAADAKAKLDAERKKLNAEKTAKKAEAASKVAAGLTADEDDD